MSDRLRAHSGKAQPLSLLVVGLSFIPIGILLYPTYLVVAAVFMFIGLRGLQHQKAVKVAAKSKLRK